MFAKQKEYAVKLLADLTVHNWNLRCDGCIGWHREVREEILVEQTLGEIAAVNERQS